MPLVRLATPARPVRPTPLTNYSSARRRRSRSSGGGGGGKAHCELQSSAVVQAPRPDEMQQPPLAQQTQRLKQLAAVMTRPATSPTSLRSFDLLRSLLPRQFVELCKVHLSFVIDVPADFLDDDDQDDDSATDRPTSQWIWQRARDSMKLKRVQNGRPEAAAATAAAVGDLAVVDRLLTRLASRPNLDQVEGIFRKCGSAARQRRLLDAVSSDNADGSKDVAESEAWTTHDLAGALKASLARLPEPLLTRRLLPYFQQVAQIGAPQPADCVNAVADDGLSAVLTARRLKALRLLVQLLPQDRRDLLGRLLALLARVADATDSATRMTPDSLGTVFGPALLYLEPGARDLAAKLNSTLAFAIRHSDAVVQVPDSVAQDADGIFRRLRQCRLADLADEAAAPPMPSLSVRFAESAEFAAAAASSASSTSDADAAVELAVAEDFTRSQVAALYATVQAMPDSAKRRRLIRRFNRTNGGLPTAPTGAGTTACSSPSPSSMATAASPLISSPVFGRLFDFPMRCLSPETAGR
ncbi:hypothetical protein BOX15_Mlig011227g2 [Macrostomum lignano]|uniref:Rho-GAP domain-containing protein n=1 Tax=Macrostomum lignano TaxID=282301 RepID=A0A267GDJ8_9PLAT|nr:hypothetical protein BOX15_Mlig011227g2 [Macrostomum lignano]